MLDNFTLMQLIETAGKDPDGAVDLYKQLKQEEGGPSEEDIKWFATYMGSVVEINGTNMKGFVKKLNKATSGFYPGSRYPIYVEIIEDDRVENNAKGQTFEYAVDQLKIAFDAALEGDVLNTLPFSVDLNRVPNLNTEHLVWWRVTKENAAEYMYPFKMQLIYPMKKYTAALLATRELSHEHIINRLKCSNNKVEDA